MHEPSSPWRLLREFASKSQTRRPPFGELAVQLSMMVGQGDLAAALSGLSERFAEAVVLHGSTSMRQEAKGLHFIVGAAARGAGTEAAPYAAERCWRLASTLRTSGVTLPLAARQMEASWPPQLLGSTTAMQSLTGRRLILLALAVGRPLETLNAAHSYVDHRHSALASEVADLVLSLSATLDDRAPASETMDAWRGLVRHFPRLYAAGALSFEELLLLARAYYVHVRRDRVEGVADTLHEVVRIG